MARGKIAKCILHPYKVAFLEVRKRKTGKSLQNIAFSDHADAAQRSYFPRVFETAIVLLNLKKLCI